MAGTESDRTDPAADSLGIELSHVGNGRATAAMTVAPSMVNSHGVCHGGVIFMLADTAMDYASNSTGGVSFAAHAEIDYLRPARSGDRLSCQATVRDRWGRTQLTDATVVNGDGETVAHFRGRTRRSRSEPGG